jgi:CheY-like chemotaxis protein
MRAPNKEAFEDSFPAVSSATTPPFEFSPVKSPAPAGPENLFDLFVQALFSAPTAEIGKSTTPIASAPESIIVPKLKALVVNGSEQHAAELCASLRSFGFDTLAAESSDQALQIVTTQPISILIVDWELPDGHGLVLAHAVRAMKRVKQPLIIGLADTLAEGVKELALDTGIDLFCDKPFSPDAIATCLIANGFSISEPDFCPAQSEPPMVDFRDFEEGPSARAAKSPHFSAKY